MLHGRVELTKYTWTVLIELSSMQGYLTCNFILDSYCIEAVQSLVVYSQVVFQLSKKYSWYYFLLLLKASLPA